MRGGDWGSDKLSGRSAYRSWDHWSVDHFDHLGFRPVLAPTTNP
jgi:formylglycine-generating enzyme required for sulfatase activity